MTCADREQVGVDMFGNGYFVCGLTGSQCSEEDYQACQKFLEGTQIDNFPHIGYV